METIIRFIKILCLFVFGYSLSCDGNVNIFAYAQQADGSISLDQGIALGLKIFPETSRTAVYSYLGIPYAQPPIGPLRFGPPKKHLGWGNRTLMTRDYKPICPQLKNYVFDESHNGFAPHTSKTDEDCLFLNIWTPQSALRLGNHSVLVIITGEEQAFDWIQNRPTGLDLAAEGIVVVSIQSRTNVFGWLSLRNVDAPGNLGLLDQRLAFDWIEENIQKFGGDRRQITLLGHGTSGATNAMLHLTNIKTATQFSRIILMSGTVYSTYSYQDFDNSTANDPNANPSAKIVKKLACDSAHVKYTLDCLRQKSVTDLLKAFEHVYEHGNYTRILGPQIDTYLPSSQQYLSNDPKMVLELGDYPDIPMMIGICSNEGAFMQELWLELAREGYDSLKKYITATILPNILAHYGFKGDAKKQLQQTINWRFFDQIPQTPAYLLNAMQRLISETKFESPFLETIERLTSDPTKLTSKAILTGKNASVTHTAENESGTMRRSKKTLFVYSFHHSKSMDIRGSINYFGGASHTSDLLFLMGPSLYQQISRRKLTSVEMRLCKKIRQLFTDFAKMGNPTPGRVFDAWRPYTLKQKFIQVLGDTTSMGDVAGSGGSGGIISENAMFATDLDRNTADIDNMIHGQTRVTSNSMNPYRIGTENIPDNAADTVRMSKSYLGVYETSDYYNSLTKINAFWRNLLPKMNSPNNLVSVSASNYSNINLRSNFADDPLYIAAMAAGTGSKFKHAFFSMLILVCLLLAILCVCVYILKKSQRNADTSFL